MTNALHQFINFDLLSVRNKLMASEDGPGWNLDATLAVEKWYRRFLYLGSIHRGIELVPTMAVDEYWHAHLSFNEKYHTDCIKLMGSTFYHQPLDESSTPCQTRSKFEFTTNAFRQEFGDDPVADFCDTSGASLQNVVAHCTGNCGGLTVI